MTFGDVNEQGYDFRLVMFMNRKYIFGVVNEFSYFSDVNELGK